MGGGFLQIEAEVAEEQAAEALEVLDDSWEESAPVDQGDQGVAFLSAMPDHDRARVERENREARKERMKERSKLGQHTGAEGTRAPPASFRNRAPPASFRNRGSNEKV